METKISSEIKLEAVPSQSKGETCNGSDNGKDACGCKSKTLCSPCIFIWGAVLIYFIISYLVR